MLSQPKRPVHGVLLLDKPTGMSSNAALQKAKRIFNAVKAGHTGSLDPLASGMLPVCFGEATKFSQYLLDANKTYIVKAQLGVKTNTGDKEGEIIQQLPVPNFTQAELLNVLQNFIGEIKQVPPMFSALKFQGQPLYKLARQGVEIPRAPRLITIYSIDLLSFNDDTFSLQVTCSKGTYIRSLIEDIGDVLGCGAHITYLHRLTVAHFSEKQMISLENLAELDESNLARSLLPIDIMLHNWPMVQIPAAYLANIQNGQTISLPQNLMPGMVKLMHEQRFLGIGEYLEGKVVPKRLCARIEG